MIYTLRYLWRKLWGKCNHPVHNSLSVMVEGVEVRSCMKCQKCITQHGDYWF
ncbi:hypothetical protein RJ729_01805 [Acinetobacter pittii]|uniref:hypothetical protein n=1 Tax=Acinetobacter pittii TaxID=48296 RepID=UPI00389173FB